MLKALAAVTICLLFSLSTSSASAAECTIIYGGGEIDCEATVSATAKVTLTPTKSPSENNQKQATKGGLPVYEPTKAATTPATGPEVFGLIGLIPAAAAGWYLRKKRG